MAKVKTPWALALSDALHRWCEEHEGYGNSRTLARELKIPDNRWGYIYCADAVVGKVEFYARIFARTGLAEADPRDIPVSHRGNTTLERAWSESELEQWWNGEGQKYLGPDRPSLIEEPPVKAEEPDGQPLQLRNLDIKELAMALRPELRPWIQEMIEEALGATREEVVEAEADGGNLKPLQLLTAAKFILQQLVDGPKDVRRDFMNDDESRKVLHELTLFAQALDSGSEQIIAMARKK